MGMTITEKILAEHAQRSSVQPGENVWVDVDVLMTHDVCGPGTIGVFKEQFGPDAKVWDPGKVVIVPDHYIFTADEKSHRNIETLRSFVREQGIKHYYDPDFVHGEGMPAPYEDPDQTGYQGVCHVALPQRGHVRPGEILLGTDSHTCTAGAFGQFATGIGNTEAAFVLGTGRLWLKVPPTMRFVFEGPLPEYLMAKDLILTIIGDIGCDGATYRAMEFCGDGVTGLKVDERMTLCNMAIEAGGKNGVIAADEVTVEYVRSRTDRPFEIVANDVDAKFLFEKAYQTSTIEPVVAKPHSPGNRDYARKLSQMTIDQAYVGGCTGGKLADLAAAARILESRHVKVPTFVVPATTHVHAEIKKRMLDGRSLEQVLLEAGCQVGPASCAACLSGPADTFGRLSQRARCISSTNRNFPGRMGHKQGEVFLASPLTVAASAVNGRITDPRELLS